jgi:hypothetical protein
MPKSIYTDLSFQGGAKATGLPTPTLSSDAATKAYVDSLVEGLSWKDSCRVATTAGITLSNPGTSTFDGVTLTSGDRVLVKDQSTPAENGIYVFNGSSTPMTRALDASTFNELEAAVVLVDEGSTNAGTNWRQTQVNGVIGTNNVAWTAFIATTPDATTTTAGKLELGTQAEVDAGTATGGSGASLAVTPATLASWSGRPKRYAAAVGDGSNTSYTITHNLGTRDVVVTLYTNSGDYDEVLSDLRHTDTNTVTLVFSSAPASNAYRVVILG